MKKNKWIAELDGKETPQQIAKAIIADKISLADEFGIEALEYLGLKLDEKKLELIQEALNKKVLRLLTKLNFI